jgi:hypothetical protein
VNWLTTSALPPASRMASTELARLVLEDAQPCDLAGEALGVVGRISDRDAEQDAQAGADRAGSSAADHDPCSEDALDDSAHARYATSRIRAKASLAMPTWRPWRLRRRGRLTTVRKNI